MRSLTAKNIFLISALAASLAGCGSTSNDSDNDKNTTPVDTTPAKISGLVESISTTAQTVTVNGYTLQAADAEISYEDNQFELAYLTVGTQVEVETSTGSATEIEIDPAITGIVSAIQDDSIVVNGISFNYADVAEIEIGSWVMISAQMQVDDSWLVSSINISPVLANAEVEGRISTLDTTNSTFTIGTMQIDYSAAYIEDGATLADGQWVEVEGSYSYSNFIATEIEVEDESDYDGVEMEGTITWVNSEQTAFEMNSRTTIQVTNQTRFEDGTQSDLSVGSIVDVEMSNSANGLVATEIEFENKQSETIVQEFSVEGFATADTESDIITINGLEFVIDARTQFKDGLSKTSIYNSWVEIEGIEVVATDLNDAYWLIKEVEAETPEATISLEGPVSDNTLWNYSAADDSLVQFNAMWVEVECTLNGDELLNCMID